MALDDQELILLAQRGDARAFETLVYRYDQQVLSMALSYVSNEEEAKDIYQEVFIRVYRALPKYQFKSQFSTWLYRIVVNACLTHQARQKSRSYVSIDDRTEEEDAPATVILSDEAETDETIINAEIAAHVQEAMAALSPQQRMVFSLRHFEGFKLREIAQIMDCAEGTVKKYLFTATERLRDRLKTVYLC
jgi:RNA polymerase sigma-70 factor (ECF subfamily)